MKYKINDILQSKSFNTWKVLIIDDNIPGYEDYYKVITLNIYNVDKQSCLYHKSIVDDDYQISVKHERKNKILKIMTKNNEQR